MSEHTRITIDADVVAGFTAAYLRVAGEECAFIEANTSHALPKLLAALSAAGRAPEAVRWVVVTHAHLDHAAGASALLRACPRATLLAHPKAAQHLVDPAKLIKAATAVYGVERFAALYGAIEPIPAERVRSLADGESFDLGGATLTVHHTRGHANHHFVVDDPAVHTVYTGDTFGVAYPVLQKRGRFVLASTSPSNFDAAEALAAIDRVLGLAERFVCLTHFGAFEDQATMADQLREWIELAGRWVEEGARGSETVAEMTTRFRAEWRRAIEAEVARRDLGFGDAEWQHLALDIDLNAQGLAVVADYQRHKKQTAAT